MRPLLHPSPEDISVEGILHALADPIRVRIFTQIAAAECSQTCSAFLECDDRAVPKSTLSQHFKVLRDAGLIRSERRGVELHNTSRCGELKERFGDLLQAIAAAHEAELARAKRRRKRSLRHA